MPPPPLPHLSSDPISQLPIVNFQDIAPNKYYYLQHNINGIFILDFIVSTYDLGDDWKTATSVTIRKIYERSAKRKFQVQKLTDNGIAVPQNSQYMNNQPIDFVEYTAIVGTGLAQVAGWYDLDLTGGFTEWSETDTILHIPRNNVVEEGELTIEKYAFSLVPGQEGGASRRRRQRTTHRRRSVRRRKTAHRRRRA
jgi:hypothetical protein